MHQLQLSLNSSPTKSDIRIAAGIRRDLGQLIADSRFEPRRVLVFSNKRVFKLYGREIVGDLRRSKLRVFEFVMPEGERYKSLRVLGKAVSFLGNSGFERNDLIVALGGGVVGDLAGFSASVYLRGIPIIQMPTTLLAQIDSSVGGKTGVNLTAGKK